MDEKQTVQRVTSLTAAMPLITHKDENQHSLLLGGEEEEKRKEKEHQQVCRYTHTQHTGHSPTSARVDIYLYMYGDACVCTHLYIRRPAFFLLCQCVTCTALLSVRRALFVSSKSARVLHRTSEWIGTQIHVDIHRHLIYVSLHLYLCICTGLVGLSFHCVHGYDRSVPAFCV